MNLRPLIDEALTEPPPHFYKQQRRLGHVTLKRALIDCHDWQEVEAIDVYAPHLVEPWSPSLALERMEVTQISYDPPDPTWEAYSRGREFAVRPTSPNPLRAVLHELSHIACRHTYEGERPSKPIREVQAEVGSFALLVLMGAIEGELLGTCRQYIAGWRNRAEEPLTEEHLAQANLAIETVWQAGR